MHSLCKTFLFTLVGATFLLFEGVHVQLLFPSLFNLNPTTVNRTTCNQTTGLQPLPNDPTCQLFSLCQSGVETVFTCGTGFSFHPQAKICARSGTFDCRNLTTFLCPLELGLFQQANTFTNYWFCFRNTPFNLTCPPNTHFVGLFSLCLPWGPFGPF